MPGVKTALIAPMKISTARIILELLGGLFGWVWIGASIASLYFLYGALANDAPWSPLIWSVGTGIIAKQVAVVLNGNHQRLDYVDQLIQRGYTNLDALAAWRTANSGGLNLLHNLQLADQGERPDSTTDTLSTEPNKT